MYIFIMMPNQSVFIMCIYTTDRLQPCSIFIGLDQYCICLPCRVDAETLSLLGSLQILMYIVS